MTKLEYLRRFTQAERVTIREVAKTNPMLEDYLELLAIASEIDLTDVDTVAAVQMLETAWLLAPGRATEILSEPAAVVPTETPAFVATHRVTLGSELLDACVDPDGTVRLSNGKWTTLDTLAAQSISLEVI